jgi:hypothetical protein
MVHSHRAVFRGFKYVSAIENKGKSLKTVLDIFGAIFLRY